MDRNHSTPLLARTLLALVVAMLAALPSGCVRQTRTPVTSLSVEGAGGSMVPPPAPEIVFGPGDKVQISVWRHEDLDMQVIVAPDGTISYPLIGRMQIAGMTYSLLQSLLTEKISVYYVDPQVSINLVESESMKVMVWGEVKTPNVLQLSSGMTVLEALTRAGGLTEDSRTDNILLVRGGRSPAEVYVVDVDALLNRADLRQNVPLEKNDILYVPEQTIVNVERFFRRIAGILAPFVSGTVVYRNIATGNPVGSASALDN